MTSVYTRPKDYAGAQPVNYLSGEDATLYKGLGNIYFNATTRKMNAMANFQLGLQLLHVFWYDLARAKFITAQQQDPRLAIAFWGEALTYKQPLWQTEDLAAAQAALVKMDKAMAMAPGTGSEPSDREKQYMAAVRKLFAANSTLQQRETQYADAMVGVCNQLGDDPDACALAALGLLGTTVSTGAYLSQDEIASIRDDANDILASALRDWEAKPHAGLLHYSTAYYDMVPMPKDPEWQSAAVRVSAQLARVAPVSSHAVHLQSHIQLRLGNWSAVISANTAAMDASAAYCTAVAAPSKVPNNTCDADNRWHALEWKLYGQTQACAFTSTAAAVGGGSMASFKTMQSVAASQKLMGPYGQWLLRTYAHVQLQSLNAYGAIGLRNATDNATAMLPPQLYDTGAIVSSTDDHFWPPHAEAHALLARVFSLTYGRTAAQQADPAAQSTVSACLVRLDAILAKQAGLNASDAFAASLNAEMVTLLTTVQLQARALVNASACAATPTDAASCGAWRPLMDQALALYATVNGSSTLPTLRIAPTPEFYGWLLAATGDQAGALQQFSDCLDQLPRRMSCLLGAARARKAQGDTASAQALYAQLQSQCAAGDAAFPPNVEARAAVVRSPPPAKRGVRRTLREVLPGSAVVAA
ncbi:hypothetical protein HYH03_002417 [Edaphochlamys debaryana]|uniref:Uncharacterized protein n=1 Tax=Edaphochlamys debaryana TaxID=47281 RepID=A0A835YAP5_9CHLO|nr:hypothetical protein HYH03_002417 [Edaphochlamys debaryana]|eukprot:KAG2499470.1 hypothetical protein HYH03_002417 [Edaphochlamys debaryana]